MKKKAFTLTELLVVVVIVGVLSAVVLPKFTKILQTRKTTEAENVMAAVRNEQEARCMIGRNYTADTTKLAALPKATSKNYTYTLDAQGITATAKDGNYTLQIPSYTDGRICCSGEGCAGLNKDYPKCGEIPDLEEATCEAPDAEPTCNLTDYTRTCQEEGYGAEYTGSVTYTVNADCTGYTKADSCTKQASGCEPTERDLDECDHDGGHWDYNSCACVPNCDVKDPQIADKKELCEDPSYSGTGAEGSWNMLTCKCDCDAGSTWQEGEGCVPTCEKTNENLGNAQTCEQPQDPAAVAGTWAWEGANACKCVCPQGSTLDKYGECIPTCEKTNENLGKAQACEQPQVVPGYTPVPGTWAWEGPNACKCICPQGSTLDTYGQCVSACAKTDENLWKAQDCEQGGQDRHVIAVDPGGEYYNIGLGTWNWATCKCDCPHDPESYLPGVTWEYVLYNDVCYLHCTSNHSGRQSIEECVYGSAADREEGIAVPGYWNQWSCQCQCATRYGAKERKTGGEVTSCYRDNCSTASTPSGGWAAAKARCEMTTSECEKCNDGYYGCSVGGLKCALRPVGGGAYTTFASPAYAKGKWREEACQCDCPAGTKLDGYSCRVTGTVDYDHYYGDGWRDNDGPDDYPDREEWPDNDPDDPELDDDPMGFGVSNGTDDSTDDPSFFGLGMGYDEETGWFGIDVVVHRGDDDGGGYLGDEGWGYYDDD